MFIFRSGVPVAVPDGYASDPTHMALVAQLNSLNRFAEAVAVLEQHPEGYLAADILTGAPWARRYLNTLARLWATQDKRLAQAATRALLGVLAGVRPRVGRHRGHPLTPSQVVAGSVAIAQWRAHVDAAWTERATVAQTLIRVAQPPLSAAHRTALRRLVRRPRVRKVDLVLSLASWQTGLPMRRLRLARPVADLVYG